MTTTQTIGTGVGGVVGGVLGSNVGDGRGRTTAIIGGTLIGAMLGGAVGKSMDEVDEMKARQALESQPTGQTYAWTNPDSGAQYAMTPTRTFETQNRPCRDYTMQVNMDGQQETVRGTACRNQFGEWENQ